MTLAPPIGVPGAPDAPVSEVSAAPAGTRTGRGAARVLAEVTRRATSSEPLEATIAFAVGELRLLLGADAVSFWDLPRAERLRLAVADGWPKPIDGIVVPLAPDSQATYVLASDAVVVADLDRDHRFVPSALLRELGYRVSVGCRVGAAASPKGLISVAFRHRPMVDDDLVSLVEGVAGVLALAVEYHRSQDDLHFRADHDPLTRLANRSSLLDAIDAVAGVTPAASALLIDLDGFKAVNDAKGHAAGDEVLQVVARRLQETIRPGDLVARLGGDEFVVLANRCDVTAARVLAERLIGAIEQLIIVGEHTVSISASVGIADCGRYLVVGEILRAADLAMYEAKAAGRGRVSAEARPSAAPKRRPSRHSNDAEQPVIDLSAIDAAIERTTVVFQPIVNVADHRTVGVEALARGPKGTSFESPAVFFAAAETFSRLRELDLAAKRAAFAAAVPDELALFLNVDPAVLADDGCREQLIETWRASDFRGDVVVELTERSLVAAPGRLLRAIESCREAGWRIALDDLGSRAETLTAMRLVRPDVAKLDMSLVDARNASHAAAVAVAVHTHRERWPLTVIAEGVETEEHEHTARDLGADLLQGFRFGRPVALADVLQARGRATHDFSRSGTGVDAGRTATKHHLLDVTRVIESMALGAESIVLSAIQSVDHYSARTRRQYAALARRCGMAGVVGCGIAPGVVGGVHHAPIPPDDQLARAWQVVVLTANGGIALLADDLGVGGVRDSERMFRYRVTRDPATVEAAAHRLLAYF